MSLTFDLVVQRPGSDLVVELRGEVADGEVLALVGPNGAGKSTALEAIAGLVELDRGRVELAGRVLCDTTEGRDVAPPDRGIGMVFQDGRLLPHLSVLDNVAFGLESRGVRRAAARREAGGWLQRVGLEGRGDARPAELSGGQAQRVALARALAVGPGLLLLDEPFAAADAASRSELRRLVALTSSHAIPTLLVTQDLVDVAMLADRVVVLQDGRAIQTGTIAEVTRRPRSDWAAKLVGVNLFRGHSDGRFVTVDGDTDPADGSPQRIVAVDPPPGEVFVTIPPSAVALYPEPPGGTPRNVWQGTVGSSETIGGRVRVTVEGPVSLVAEVTPAAVAELGLRPGGQVWAVVKATEVDTYPL